MTKLVSSLTALAFCAAVASGAVAADKKSPKGSSMHSSMMGGAMSHKCGPGKSYVHGYTKKDGTKVKGYCR